MGNIHFRKLISVDNLMKLGVRVQLSLFSVLYTFLIHFD